MTLTMRRILQFSSFPLWFAVWFALTKDGVVSPRALPPPDLVFRTFLAEIVNGNLVSSTIISATRAFAGFALAAPIGVLLGALLVRIKLADRLLEPFIFGTYPIPKVALYPILSFVFGIGSGSKIAFAALESVYPIIVASSFAIRGVRTKLIWVAQSMGTSRARLLSRVILPAAFPGIFTGFRIALPISLLVAIVAEMIGDSQGLGYYIVDAGRAFRADKIYAGVIAAGFLGYIFDAALSLTRRVVIPNAKK